MGGVAINKWIDFVCFTWLDD